MAGLAGRVGAAAPPLRRIRAQGAPTYCARSTTSHGAVTAGANAVSSACTPAHRGSRWAWSTRRRPRACPVLPRERHDARAAPRGRGYRRHRVSHRRLPSSRARLSDDAAGSATATSTTTTSTTTIAAATTTSTTKSSSSSSSPPPPLIHHYHHPPPPPATPPPPSTMTAGARGGCVCVCAAAGSQKPERSRGPGDVYHLMCGFGWCIACITVYIYIHPG